MVAVDLVSKEVQCISFPCKGGGLHKSWLTDMVLRGGSVGGGGGGGGGGQGPQPYPFFFFFHGKLMHCLN